VGRIEAGTIRIERLNFRLLDVVGKAIGVMDAEVKRKRLVTRLVSNDDADGWFLGDPYRIEQILLNYLSNAVKFTESGEILIHVQGSSQDGLMHIRIAVTDNGPGIAPEAQTKLFQRFSQVDGSSTRRTGGVGLGLSISRRLAELMGGSVGLESTPGQGATFWLQLALAPSIVADVKPGAFRIGRKSEQGRVLLAEDNPINQKVAIKALGILGWEADVAPNGLAALDLFCRKRYSLVLMDCHMPEMDGYDATRKIREWEQHRSLAQTPVVALTANAMIGERELCLAAGMNDHLAKPFVLEQLNEILERWSPHAISPE
jgi:CheY-like chemotaxis protein